MNMKTTRTIRTAIKLIIPLLAMAALAPTAGAQTINKANNSDALNLTTSWVGGVVPGSGNIALWTSSVAATNITTITGSVSFLGISNTGSQAQQITGGGTLNLGASGIASSMQFHMAGGGTTTVNLMDNQTWNLAWNYNNLSGTNINTGGFTLTSISGAAPVNGNIFGVVTGSGGFTVAGGVTHLGANTYTGTTTLNSGVMTLDGAEIVGTSGPMGKSAAANPGSIVFGGGTLRYTATNQNDYSGRFSTAASQAYNVDTNGQTVTWDTALTSSGGTLTMSAVSGATAGTLILTGANTYSGTTTISLGTLKIGNGGAAGTLGSGDVTDNANLTFNRSDTFTVGNAITGSGSLTQAGAGTTILTGTNAYSGATLISAGTLQNGDGGATGSFGTGAITNNANITYNHSNIIALDHMSGTGSVTVNGTNAVWVQNAEAYTGTTTINNGANGLWLGVHNALGSLSGSSTITGSGILVLSRTDNTTLSNNITGGVQLLMNDAGVVTMTGANSYTGKTIMWSGGMTVSSFNSVNGGTPLLATSSLGAPTTPTNGAIGMGQGSTVTLTYTGTGETTDRILGLAGPTGSGAILDQAGTGLLKFTGAVNSSASGAITLTLRGSTAGTGEMSGAIGNSSFATGVTKTGTGTWTLSGANTYTGLTTVSAGTLAEGVSNAISTGALTVDGATAIFNLGASHTDSVGTVTLANGGSITGTGTSALTSTATFAMQSGSVGAILAGSVGLTKSTAGTVTLSAANTYTGVTTISAGTLVLASSGSIAASSAVDLGTSGTFNVSAVSGGFSLASGQTLKGSGTVTGAITVASGATLAIGNSPGTVTFDNNLTLASGSISNFEINGFTTGLYDLAQGGVGSQTVNFNGTINLVFQSGFNTQGTVTIFNFENYAGTFGTVNTSGLASGYTATFNNLTGIVTVVPEPSTWALLAFSLTTVMVMRRRNKGAALS